jgi:hypothetical protein
MAVDFLKSFCEGFSYNQFPDLRLSSDLTESERAGAYTVCFDYAFGGARVLPLAEGEGERTLAHTVEMEIDRGYLKAYRQYLRRYEPTGEQVGAPQLLQTVDFLASDALQTAGAGQTASVGQIIHIADAALAYADDGGEVLRPKWTVLLAGEKNFVTN